MSDARKDALVQGLKENFSRVSDVDLARIADSLLADLDVADPVRNPKPETFKALRDRIDEAGDTWVTSDHRFNDDVSDFVAKEVFVFIAEQ